MLFASNTDEGTTTQRCVKTGRSHRGAGRGEKRKGSRKQVEEKRGGGKGREEKGGCMLKQLSQQRTRTRKRERERVRVP